MTTHFTESDATFSPCKTYRYSLTRGWRGEDATEPTVLWVMLNPSTADADKTDPTVRKCIAFTSSWGFSRMQVGNVFAMRATNPCELKRAMQHGHDPIGPKNEPLLLAMARNAALVVAGWGRHARLQDRGAYTLDRLASVTDVHCLRLNDDGSPAHPLYLPVKLSPSLLRGRLAA